MNLEELRQVQSKERRTDSLQSLRPSFYQEVGEYIATLKAERKRAAEQASDPFSSPEVNRLTDEIETATDVVEAIYERRMGKLVKQASLAAAGMAADDEGLTAEEADLFDGLVERIQTNKGRVLDVLDEAESASPADDVAGADAIGTDGEPGSETPPAPPDEPPISTESPPSSADPAPTDTPPALPDAPPDRPDLPSGDESVDAADGAVSAADVMGGEVLPADGDVPSPDGGEPSSTPPERPTDTEAGADTEAEADTEPTEPNRGAEADSRASDADHETTEGNETPGETAEDVDRVTVRITRDVGSILGIDDREYTLKSDDVVTLPEQNATPLVEREAAEPLE